MQSFTPVPNDFFDILLKQLSQRELKVLLVIIRQTYGWTRSKGSEHRRSKARILFGQFKKQTGLSIGSIHRAIKELHQRKLIIIYDYHHKELHHPSERQGKPFLMYALDMQHLSSLIEAPPHLSAVQHTSITSDTRHLSPVIHNKRKKKKKKERDEIENQKKTLSGFEGCKAFIKQLKNGKQ